MKKMSAIYVSALVSLSLLVSLPAFGGGGINVEDGKPVIVKVCGGPVGIESNFKKERYVDEPKMCYISYGVIPGHEVKIKIGETLRIKVIGDDDIVVLCNGEKGITISRE